MRPEDLQAAMGTSFPPSPEQWDVITAPLEPAVVIAGAGSGKTTAMAARVVYLVLTEQVRPEQVLGLTFTTKAAGELRTRIRTALRAAGVLRPDTEIADAEVLEPTVATYNSWAATLLLDHGLRIGHEPDTRVIANAARFQLGARAIDGYTGEVSLLTDHPETAIQNLLALDGSMSEHLVSPEQVREVDAEALAGFRRAYDAEAAGKARKTHLDVTAKAVNAIQRRGELLGLVDAYRRLKGELGLMDFSDQVALAARLAGTQPDVGRQQREQFPVVLLDEYQDTSVAQADLLALVFSGAADDGLGHAVMAVGDPNQAIYGWRGASASNITRFPETFPAAVGVTATYPLTVNRRSDVRILETANRLAEPLYALGDSVARLAPGGSEPGEVSTRVFERRDEELAWLVDSVRAAHTDAWSDIGVLVRDNAHAEDVFDTLANASIPVEIVGLSGLVRLPEIAEVVAILHLLQDVTANAQLLTLLTGARWAIGPRDLKLLSRRAAHLAGRGGREEEGLALDAHLLQIAEAIDPSEVPSLNDALEDPGQGSYSSEARERFALLAAELRRLRRYVGEPLLDLVRRVVDTTGVDVELASSVSASAPARRDNLDLFVKAVAEFQAVDGDVSLAALLAYLTAEDETGNGLEATTPTDADSVKLLTVHRAKGLEWHTVFLVGVCETR
ncbi:MAG: UvrD/REP helicase, partial [Nocardioidaceae bacterium]|nr:UvrD/REP helicase [Nocardioidaceae bacterium]